MEESFVAESRILKATINACFYCVHNFHRLRSELGIIVSVFHQYLNVPNTKTTLDQYLLVIQYYIRKPDILTGHVEVLDTSIVLRVPRELVVRPLLLHPHVGGQNLSPHVLQHVICEQSLSQLLVLTTPITWDNLSLMWTVSLSELLATGRINLENEK